MTKPSPIFTWAADPSALVTYPPSALVGVGWDAGEQPAAAHMNALLNNIGLWIEYLEPYAGNTAGDWTANRVTWYNNSNQDGLYLNAGSSPNGVELRSFDLRSIQLRAEGASDDKSIIIDPVTSKITFDNITSLRFDLGSIYTSASDIVADWQLGYFRTQLGMSTGRNSTTLLRYAYDSDPTFLQDHSPVTGGYMVCSATSDVLELDNGSGGAWSVGTAAALATFAVGARTVLARKPILFNSEVIGGPVATVYKAASMTGRFRCVGAATNVSVVLYSMERSTMTRTVVGAVGSSATAMTSHTTTFGGTPVALTPTTHAYYLEISVDDSKAAGIPILPVDFADIEFVTLSIQKTAVE